MDLKIYIYISLSLCEESVPSLSAGRTVEAEQNPGEAVGAGAPGFCTGIVYRGE